MSYLLNNQQKLNDIIFADRNKQYGAYELRSSYGSTLVKSIALMLLGSGSIFSIAMYLAHRGEDPKLANLPPFIHDTVYVIPFDNTAKQAPQKSETPFEKSAPTENNSSEAKNLLIVDSLAASQTTSVETNVSSNGSSTVTGLATTSTGNSTSSSTLNVAKSGTEVKGNYEVDTQPEFEGGLNALRRFVGMHLRYPARASEDGVEGTVFVRFVVDESGKVGSLTLQNNLGYGLDEEALRVVGMIPKFKSPAMVNGQAVKVYFQLPIRYKLR